MTASMATNPRIKPVERATNRTWDEWLRFMDAIDARNLDHKEIALKVYEELDGTIEQLGWWTQAVTVAYEQYIGRRIPGQRPDGTFQTSVSRSTTLGMEELMEKWTKFAAEDERRGRDRAGHHRRGPAGQQNGSAHHVADEGPGRLLRHRHQRAEEERDRVDRGDPDRAPDARIERRSPRAVGVDRQTLPRERLGLFSTGSCLRRPHTGVSVHVQVPSQSALLSGPGPANLVRLAGDRPGMWRRARATS
jgi:hypothetical protein